MSQIRKYLSALIRIGGRWISITVWAAAMAWTGPAVAALPNPILFQASFENTLQAVDTQGAPVPPFVVQGNVAYQPGKVGQALVCGGDGALVEYLVAGHILASQGTVAMWVKAIDWPAGEQAFHVFFETQGPGWLVLYKFWNAGLLMLSGVDQAHYGSASMGGCPLTDGRWHHLAGVWEAKRLSLYVDGVLTANLLSPPLPQSLLSYFTFGDNGWGVPHTSHTLLDEATIYRYALPDDQIARLAQGLPLTYQPTLGVSVQPWPTQGKWKVTVNACGLLTSEGGPGVTATVQILNRDGVTVASSGTVTSFTEGLGSVMLDITSVAVGSHPVRAILLDAGGQEVTRSQVSFSRPANAPWINNTVGMTDKVLAPLTAMSADTATGNVQCWGRTYTMNGLFPRQIQSAGQAMLTGSGMYLSVSTAGGPETVSAGTGTIASASATRVQHTGSVNSASGNFALATAGSIEYDGMLWDNLTLTPHVSTTLTDVTLHIPVNAANALYYHYGTGSYEDTAGLLPAEGFAWAGFLPFLWVGDDDRGLGWFAEAPQGWSNANGVAAQRIVRTDNATVEMQISFINQPTPVTAGVPLSFSFGVQATPVKPRPADARTWRPNGWDDLGNDIGGGNIEIVWPTNNMAYFGYPWPQDPEGFSTFVADRHARGIRVIVYINLNYLSTSAPEYTYYAGEWTDPGRTFTENVGGEIIGACPASAAWRDFIAYKIAAFVDAFQVDGIYIDCWEPTACLVESHGCGWRDASGIVHGRVPLRGAREIVRRVREIFQDRMSNPHITIHMSADVVIPILAFGDSMLDGEQYQGSRAPNDDYLSVVPLDKWRAQNTGRQWGVVPFFLPEFAMQWRPVAYPTDRLMGILLAHDCTPWPAWCNTQEVFNAWGTVDQFGIANADFHGYWTANGVTTDNPAVVASVYQKPGQALLAILNSGTQAASVTINVDGNNLLGQALWSARNAVDNTTLPVVNQGFGLANLAGRGYQLVTLTASGATMSAVLTAMDARPGDGNWNPQADYDGDGEVSSTDLSICLANSGGMGGN